MRIRPYGDQGALIEFEDSISVEVHDKVTTLYQQLTFNLLTGVHDIIPAYHSLTVCFNPSLLNYQEVEKWILEDFTKKQSAPINSCTYRLPVCYDLAYGLDLDTVSNRLDLTSDEIIQLHIQKIYRLYCIGFMPGFTYLGKLEPPLVGKRLESPRTKVPDGSVGIAGEQTGIYPADLPGGWEIVGKCPVPTFLPELKDPFPFKVGDNIQFYPIEIEEFKLLKQKDWTTEKYTQFLV